MSYNIYYVNHYIYFIFYIYSVNHSFWYLLFNVILITINDYAIFFILFRAFYRFENNY